MRARVRSIALAALLCAAASAQADWSVSLDVEHFKWQESTEPTTVTEKGPRFGFSWEYEYLRPAGWQFAYRGKFRRGTVDYTGSFLFDPNQKALARTEYTGVVNEAQGIYRLDGSPFGLEFVGGLGWDWWRRNILPDQKEDYSVLFARLGMNLDRRERQGWFGGGGVKWPFYVSENAYLNELGFNQNPSLQPKGRLSVYAQAGYRFSPQWSLIGYYDTYRFGESDAVAVTHRDFAGQSFLIFQPASDIDTFGLRLRYSFR